MLKDKDIYKKNKEGISPLTIKNKDFGKTSKFELGLSRPYIGRETSTGVAGSFTAWGNLVPSPFTGVF